jgi:uncharacterized membrane protein
MSEEKDQFQHLQQKLADLQKRQEQFQSEILQIKKEIERLIIKPDILEADNKVEIPVQAVTEPAVPKEKAGVKEASEPLVETKSAAPSVVRVPSMPEEKIETDLERFIGENLINKIGIAITVIGVGIGAKYAIDHRLISPLARIIMGYLVGLGLLFFAVWLKKQYENFSAVLLSGSMAIMYFITYAAYSFYGFYPQVVSFILMVIFTVFTVMGALRYNREIIAVIGMVGAFAVPFLLSEGSENVLIFFSYTAIINCGILVIAIKKYWKPLYFSAFVFTWLIYFTWFFGSYRSEKDYLFALIFLFVFFIIFYITFLSYKLVRKEKFNVFDILLLLSNSFIFYGTGYYILNGHPPGDNQLGLFTLGNAIIHFLVSLVIYRNKLADRNLFYFVSGLMVVFLTIAIPVQLNGNWVTLLWICEAAILFCIGRMRSAPVYEDISYPLIIISFLSQVEDWNKLQMSTIKGGSSMEFMPVLNIQFLSSVIFIAALAVILVIYFSKKYPSPFDDKLSTAGLLNYALPALFILIVYLTLRTEIIAYYNHLYEASKVDISVNGTQTISESDFNIPNFKIIWLCNYSLFFFAVLSLINTFKIKHSFMGIAAFWLSFLTMFVFLFQSLYVLSELRESYIGQIQPEYFPVTFYNVSVRYISFIFVALSLASVKLWIRKESVEDYYQIIFSLLFHLALLWILCSEMLNIMDLLKNTHSYKFGLSILSGIYALILIVLGIINKKRYLRIAAMVLLGVTLAKLFFYDITRLDTILKTILFLALGFLLLVVSFLYNKYRIRLYGEAGEEPGT